MTADLDRAAVFTMGNRRSRSVRIIRELIYFMRLKDQADLEILRLRTEITELKREIARLERELEAQQLGLPTFTISENQLVLFEL